MKQKMILCLLSIAILLTGCSTEEAKMAPTVPRVTGGMEKEPVLDYTVPDCAPGILVNQAGYTIEDRKVAIFRGKNLPDTFRVCNAGTGAVVFEGDLEIRGNDKVTGEQIGYASFTELQTPGEYYIKSDILGYSYTFPVNDKIYEDLLDWNLHDLYSETENRSEFTEEEIKNTCKAMINMLLACEMHGEVFGDDMGVNESGNGIPDLIDIMHAQIVLLGEQKDMILASTDWEMVSYYASAIAKFSYTYKEYDSVFATTCLQLSDSVWRYMEKNAEQVDGSFRFMTAAELYRVSGGGKYHNNIKEYCRDTEEPIIKNREAVYGAVTYIATRQQVDVDICARFMKEIMNEAENISARAGNSFYQVNGTLTQENNDEIMWDMVVLTIVDYVIANQEYASIIENHLHYLLGRNSMAISYVDGVGEREYSVREGQQSVMDGGFMESALLFMLSEVNDKGGTEEE